MNDMKQPEALRLARELEGVYPVNIQDQEAAATELRRLHAENEQLRADLEAIGAGGVGPLMAPATTEESSAVQPQGEQEPVAWIENLGGGISYNPYHDAARKLPDGVRFDLYVHQQNLRCKSNQARLAALWGYEKKQPPRQPLTDEQINDELNFAIETPTQAERAAFRKGIKLAERAHGIGGEA